MIFRIILLLAIGSLLTGCAARHDERLSCIAGTVADYPKEALDSLRMIDRSSLSEADRHYHDFLTIKAGDKAYIVHGSDSLILDVLDYYSRQDKEGLYPEALYYGGRVYSDLGDYPNALRFFQSALDELPDKPENLRLKGTVSSQTGRLLGNLRLYNEAIPYLEQVLAINRMYNDTVNEVYNLQLLGSIHMDNGDYIRAEANIRTAIEKSRTMTSSMRAKSAMNMAAVKLHKGEIDSALIFIRHAPETVRPMTRNTALAIAAEIYQKAGILDTAYHYAQQLIQSPDSLNRTIGYHILLSPQLIDFSNEDSVKNYLQAYVTTIENRFNENGNQLALNQRTLYNYQFHERARKKAEKYSEMLKVVLIVALVALLIATVIILYYKNRHKQNLLNLHEARENIKILKDKIQSGNQLPVPCECHDVRPEWQSTEQSLQEKLRRELMDLAERNEGVAVPDSILRSEVYKTLREMAESHQCIKQNAGIWQDLEETVLEASPKFLSNLILLTSGKLTPVDRQTALLIKCGFRQAEITTLCSITNGAAGSRRANLGKKICGVKMDADTVSRIIRLL